MAKTTITLLGTSAPDDTGIREWRFVVNGQVRAYVTVHADTRAAAIAQIMEKLNGTQQLARLSDDSKSGAGAVVAVGALGLLAYGVYKFAQWWNRDEDGPSDGWGIGFGTGNGWVNLNPFDKGKAGTGDGGADIGEQWERVQVLGIKGWRRKGIPLPKQKGGPATYQAAVLIVSEDGSIPDLSGWPDTLPVFFINDRSAPYPDVDGGWYSDVLFGSTDPEKKYGKETRVFECAETDSESLRRCMKDVIANSLSIQWV